MPFNLFAPNVPAGNAAIDLTPPDIQAPAPNFQSPWLNPTSAPSPQNSLEYSDAFRKAAGSAWMSMTSGARRGEAGFLINNAGQAGPTSIWFDAPNATHPGGKIQAAPDTMALFHTHPNYSTEGPSPTDINSARTSRRTIYVQSRGGLYAIDPGGQVTHLFSHPDWMTSKNPQ